MLTSVMLSAQTQSEQGLSAWSARGWEQISVALCKWGKKDKVTLAACVGSNWRVPLHKGDLSDGNSVLWR